MNVKAQTVKVEAKQGTWPTDIRATFSLGLVCVLTTSLLQFYGGRSHNLNL